VCFLAEARFVVLFLGPDFVGVFFAPIRKDSRFRPAFSAATSQSGTRPRPVQAFPLSSRYLGATDRPVSGLALAPRPLLIAKACRRSASDNRCFLINVAAARRPFVPSCSSRRACTSKARIRARITAADEKRGILVPCYANSLQFTPSVIGVQRATNRSCSRAVSPFYVGQSFNFASSLAKPARHR
jgi:hypothetical protein